MPLPQLLAKARICDDRLPEDGWRLVLGALDGAHQGDSSVEAARRRRSFHGLCTRPRGAIVQLEPKSLQLVACRSRIRGNGVCLAPRAGAGLFKFAGHRRSWLQSHIGSTVLVEAGQVAPGCNQSNRVLRPVGLCDAAIRALDERQRRWVPSHCQHGSTHDCNRG